MNLLLLLVWKKGNFVWLIRQLKEDGITILYISHRLEEIENLCDRISILRNGKWCILLKRENYLKKKYWINDRQGIYWSISCHRKNNRSDLLDVKNYCCIKEGIDNISFHIRAGKIVGFGGLVGSGRTELAKSYFYRYTKKIRALSISIIRILKS